MAKKITRSRPWTKEEVRMLKALEGQQTDRAEAQAERDSGVSAGIEAGRDAGRRSREKEGVKRTVPFMVIVGTVDLPRLFGLGNFATVGRSATADRHVRFLRGTCRRRQRSSAAASDPEPTCDRKR
jgi:hypothetical protein